MNLKGQALARRRFWSDLGDDVGVLDLSMEENAKRLLNVTSTNVANFHLELERNNATVLIENWNWLLATLPHWQHLTSETRKQKHHCSTYAFDFDWTPTTDYYQ